MKKFLSLMLSLLLTFSISVPVFADQVSGDAVVGTTLTRNQTTTITAEPDGSWKVDLGVFIEKQGSTPSAAGDNDPSSVVKGVITASSGVTLSKTTWSVDSYQTVYEVTASGKAFATGDYTVTFSTSNSKEPGISRSSDTVTIHVVVSADTTDPTIIAPADITTEATGPLTAVTLGNATVSDNVSSGTDLEVNNNAPVAGFPVGTTTVTWTATDKAGNSATATQAVTITDTTAPTITAPAAITTEATGPLTAVILGSATASDLVSSGDDLVITNNASTAGFPVGSTTVTWTATDKAGNKATDTQTVIVQDTTPPTITAPEDVTTEATGPLTAVNLGNATASDLVSSGTDLTVTNDASKTGFPVGTTTVTWTATDKAGNKATDTQTVIVQDTTAPTIIAPAAVHVKATGKLTTVNLGSAIASDLVSSGDDLKITNDAPESFPVGTTIVTWTATDKAGNFQTATQVVTVTYNYSGVLQPINRQNNSQFKAGSTVPVKFNLTTENGGYVDFASATISFKVGLPAASTTVAESSYALAASLGNVFRYDSTNNQYIFNLSTKGYASGWYTITITLDDGTSDKVSIFLK